MPTNKPVDVVARKIRELMDWNNKTKELIVLRGHSKDTTKIYLYAYSKLEHKARKKYQDLVKTPKEL